jgi:hypothetical protein
MNAFFALTLVITAVVGQPPALTAPTAIDRAFNRLYNFDFAGAHAILNEHLRAHPNDPLAYSVRGAAYLFSEFNRLKILELEFFADDDSVTDKKRIKPDVAARERVFQATSEAKRLAKAHLALDANNRDALMAYCIASAIETDYIGLVDKKYFRSYSLSKETQRYARRLLSLNPPEYDGYLTLGAVEYVVANLNFFFRLFVHFDGIEGSRQKSIENLKQVVQGGHYFSPYAKILMSVVYLREQQPEKSLALLKEMERDFPENPLIPLEISRIEKKIQSKESKQRK